MLNPTTASLDYMPAIEICAPTVSLFAGEFQKQLDIHTAMVHWQ